MIISIVVPKSVIANHRKWVNPSCEAPLFHSLSIAAENATFSDEERDEGMKWVREWLVYHRGDLEAHCMRQYGEIKDSAEWNKEG